MYRSTKVLGGVCLTLTLALAPALTGCGGGNSGFIIPVESPLKPWVVQSEDEILEKAGIEQAADEGTADEDFVDYEDEEDEEAAPKPAAPTPAPAKPAPAPAKVESKAKPVK